MAKFKYKALNSNGETVQDAMEAIDRKDLMSKLRSLSLSPMEISEEAESSGGGDFAFMKKYLSSSRVTRKNITQFTSQLSALINAKMNLARALNSLKEQSPNEGMQAIVGSLLDDVQKGKNLSDALEEYPVHFSSMYINMIKIGEVGGVLDKALERLVDMRTKDEQLMGKIKGALAYPAVMAVVMLGSIIVMLTFVIPKFSGVFKQMGGNLPFTTQVVLGTSDFLKTWWWLVIIVLGLAAAGGYYLLTKDEYRYKFDRFKLSLPIFGPILKAICISRFSLAMGALLSSGVSMMKALDSTISITGNFFIEKALKQIAEEVRQGGTLSGALRARDSIFPSLMIGMAGTGEDAGSLDEMLGNVGEFFRKESEEKINTLTTLLEPIMIVVMGSVVGFIVSAILLPIFNVSTSIH